MFKHKLEKLDVICSILSRGGRQVDELIHCKCVKKTAVQKMYSMKGCCWRCKANVSLLTDKQAKFDVKHVVKPTIPLHSVTKTTVVRKLNPRAGFAALSKIKQAAKIKPLLQPATSYPYEGWAAARGFYNGDWPMEQLLQSKEEYA